MATTIITHVPVAMVPDYTNMYLNMGATSVTPVPTGPGEVMLLVVFPDAGAMHAAVGPTPAGTSNPATDEGALLD